MICPRADFDKVSLDKHVVDGHIEIVPLSEDKEDNSGNEPITPAADPQD